MLPDLAPVEQLSLKYQAYIDSISSTSFQGDVEVDLASRLTMAVDNSIYQVLPQAVIYPKNATDIQVLFQLAHAAEFIEHIRFSPRGGGTGTNGQSLTPGIILDCTRYMNQILAVNAELGWVRVQPGVVLDELNAFLKPHGVFFAPSLSPSNRATLGGMCGTDACGLGSCRYGRTSEHIIGLDCILSDGTGWHSSAIAEERLAECEQIPGIVGKIHQVVVNEIQAHAKEINKQFPQLPRHMTGYNLAKVFDAHGHFNLNYLLSGSEGTLACITELTLNVLPLPKKKWLFAVKYAAFDGALRAARDLLPLKPTAIETIDDNIWLVAKQDEIYRRVQPLLDPERVSDQTKAINFIELSGDDFSVLETQKQQVEAVLTQAIQHQEVLGFCVTDKAEEMTSLWDLRKKSVGLLANVVGDQRPMPFVEDTAVAPENLPEYIAEFRNLLESYGLRYGMFGHVDAGCLHVRPALNMQSKDDRRLITEITAKVNGLVQKYGGVLWSEHGRGFRTVFTEDYFGATLFECLRRIKTSFDPYDKLNPGKIATSVHNHVQPVPLEGPMRGEQDQQITQSWQKAFPNVLKCNGNAQCFDYQLDHVMCPSMKVTRNRLHSPKGRATAVREWLRQLSVNGYTFQASETLKSVRMGQGIKPNEQDFSQQVYEAMSGCLGCKACTSACPVHVDIPSVKAQFLAHYHAKYRRPLRDYLIGNIENIARLQAKFGLLGRAVAKSYPVKWCLQKIGLVDTPVIQKPAKIPRAARYHASKLQHYLQSDRPLVAIVPDAFTSLFECGILQATYQLLDRLGYQVLILPLRENGKGRFSKGFIQRFKQIAQDNNDYLRVLSAHQIPLVGIEPTTTLCYQDEYQLVLGKGQGFYVRGIAEWLWSEYQAGHWSITMPAHEQYYQLLSHCSERALSPDQSIYWQHLFECFGQRLSLTQTGCCGMAGSYGHEREHVGNSKRLFALSWQDKLSGATPLATGYSCRSQVKRCAEQVIQHPIVILANII